MKHVKYTSLYKVDVEKNRNIEFETEVSNVLHDIAKLIAEEKAGCSSPKEKVEITANVDENEVKYFLRCIDGDLSVYVSSDTLSEILIPETVFEKKFCTDVRVESGKYGFYELKPLFGNHAIAAWHNMPKEVSEGLLASGCIKYGQPIFEFSFGRMAVEDNSPWRKRTYYMPLSMFWIIYEKLITTGCNDISNVHYNKKPVEQKTVNVATKIQVGPSYDLYKKLMEFSKETVKKAQIKTHINAAIIEESKSVIDSMRNATTVEQFNSFVLNLVSILQRPVDIGKGDGIKNLLADNKKDFQYIIQREEDLIAAMEGIGDDTFSHIGTFNDCGVEVYLANDKQKEQVMRKLSDDLKPRVKNIYRVVPQKQKQRFNQYLEENDIKKVIMLWHGSRNENWLSIIKNSLALNPNAVITGKMFGKGIYFAPSSKKSWGYTSIRGSYWASGHADTAFMGLYAVAYGRPYDVYAWGALEDYPTQTKNNHKNCLHAHAGSMLRNDEIVFYHEDAVLLNYIVEFA